MESLTTNQKPSPLDQAYKKYKDELRTNITGAVSEQDLVRGIMDNTISRDRIGELKKQIITPEDFRSYYPRELSSGTRLKNNYSEREIQVVGGRGRVFKGIQVLSDGQTIFTLGEDNINLWIQRYNWGDLTNEGFSFNPIIGEVTSFQVLPDMRIVTGGVGINMLMPKDNGKYEKKELIIEGDDSVGEVLSLQALPNGKIIFGASGGLYAMTPRADGKSYEREELRSVVNIDYKPVVCFQVLLDGRIVTGGAGLSIWTPRADGSYEINEIEESNGDFINCLQVLPEGKIMTGDRSIDLWTPRADGKSYEREELRSAAKVGSKPAVCFQVLLDGKIIIGVGKKIIILE